jgi:hypothetical protein
VTTLSAARTAAAAALDALAGFTVRARPLKAAQKAGDGWIVLGRLVPADFSSSYATLQAVIVLSPDAAKAEQVLEDNATALVNAITSSDLDPTDVSLEPEALIVGETSSPLYAAVLTFTVEVT